MNNLYVYCVIFIFIFCMFLLGWEISPCRDPSQTCWCIWQTSVCLGRDWYTQQTSDEGKSNFWCIVSIMDFIFLTLFDFWCIGPSIRDHSQTLVGWSWCKKNDTKNFQPPPPFWTTKFFMPPLPFFPQGKYTHVGINPTENHINLIFKGKINMIFFQGPLFRPPKL